MNHNNDKPVRDNFLVFGQPKIEDDEIEEVLATLKSGWLGTGPKVAQFESDFARYKNIDPSNIAAVNSCTAALHVSMIAAGLGLGDEVITTALTFCATVNAIIHSGATPVLVDVKKDTMNIEPNAIENAITPKTRAIVPVHFAGRPCDMDSIMDIAKRHDLKVIEDCAHAIESEYKGQKIGTLGDFGCFSFYVTKNIVTGEGGMVLAREQKDIDRIKIISLHGMTKDAWKRFSDSGHKHYKVIECGYKYNMMDLQAAIGIHQLKRIQSYWNIRESIWNKYQQELSELSATLPTKPEHDTIQSYHLYTILIDQKICGISRDSFLDKMIAQNIGIGVHYLCIAEHPFYQNQYGWKPDDYPNATRIGQQTVSLPLSAKLTNEDVADVVKAVKISMA